MQGLLLGLLLLAPPRAHRVVVSLTASGTQVYNVVLGNVENIRKDFAPEPVEIEVVCFASGVDMLLKSSHQGARLMKLSKAGVVFAACASTLRARKIDPKAMVPFTKVVPSGAAEVVRKQEAGWAYLKGGF